MRVYQVYVTPQARAEMKDLPGNMKQRVKHTIEELAKQPEPARSKELATASSGAVVYRLRIDKWRIVYAVNQSTYFIRILTVRKRPPYDYYDFGRAID